MCQNVRHVCFSNRCSFCGAEVLRVYSSGKMRKLQRFFVSWCPFGFSAFEQVVASTAFGEAAMRRRWYVLRR